MKKHLLSFLVTCAFSISAIAQTPCSDIFISEYVEGLENNHAIELFNPTGGAIDLSQYQMGRFRDGSGTPMLFILSGVIQPYATYVIALDKRNPNGTGNEVPIDLALEAVADTFVNPIYIQANSPFYFNGDDAFGLITNNGTQLVDLIGKIGEDPGTAWSDQNGVSWTRDHTLIRKPTVQSGVSINPTEFIVETEWDSLPANTFSNLGWHVCNCSTCPPTFSTTTVSTCGTFTWNNTAYSQSGTYIYETTNSFGCDSIATLDLTITQSYSVNESYILCGGETVTVGGTTYSQEGQYSQTIPGNGCDTLVSISITEEQEPSVNILGNTQIVANSTETYAIVQPQGYTITWSATNGTILSGQGTVSVTIFWDGSGGGEVSVTISNGDCSYTYALVVGTFVGIESEWISNFDIYPNPSDGVFKIELEQYSNVHVFDATGKMVVADSGIGSFSLDLSQEPSGLFVVKVYSDESIGLKRVLKN
ncbi:MAG: lamin tail domain-containing protein [Flavobacteriales bacterium]